MEFLDYLNNINKHTYHPDNDCKSKFKIKDIFNDHWYSFLNDNPHLEIRPVVHSEVKKMMGCGSLSREFMPMNLLKGLLFISLINILMSFDIMAYMLKNINTLIK